MPLPFCRRGAFDLVAYLIDITQIETHFDNLNLRKSGDEAFYRLVPLRWEQVVTSRFLQTAS